MPIKGKTGSESAILSVGAYRPARLVSNSEIVDAIDSSDEWIIQRTGIESRRFANADESVVDMAIGAAEQALSRAKLTIKDIDSVIVATITYPHQAPSAATAIIQRMGNPTAAAFDIAAAWEFTRAFACRLMASLFLDSTVYSFLFVRMLVFLLVCCSVCVLSCLFLRLRCVVTICLHAWQFVSLLVCFVVCFSASWVFVSLRVFVRFSFAYLFVCLLVRVICVFV